MIFLQLLVEVDQKLLTILHISWKKIASKQVKLLIHFRTPHEVTTT